MRNDIDLEEEKKKKKKKKEKEKEKNGRKERRFVRGSLSLSFFCAGQA